jgi:hypothetical protein
LADAADRRFQLWRVGRVAFFNGVVEDDPVDVVDDLGLVAEPAILVSADRSRLIQPDH